MTAGDKSVPRPAHIPAAKWEKLLRFLETLPLGAATKLFAALESDRARNNSQGRKSVLPNDALIDTLRPLIIGHGGRFPPRTQTAQRLFFTPFEDFLQPVRRGRKRRARIPRSSLAPIWELIRTDPACAEAARAAKALDELLLSESAPDQPKPVPSATGDGEAHTDEISAPGSHTRPLSHEEAVDEAEAALFRAAAEGLSKLVGHASEDAGYRADLSKRLGGGQQGAAALLDLVELSDLLPAADYLKSVQKAFPRPVATLSEDELFEVRRHYAAAYWDQPEAAPYLLLCLAGRMEAPWRALRIHYHIAATRDAELMTAREDSSLIVESLFEDLESTARALERDAEGEFDADDARLRLEYFADYAAGLISEARRKSDNVTVNRAEASRDVVASALTRFAEQALADMRAATPTRHAGGSSKLMALRPDIDRELQADIIERACAASEFLAEADKLASALERPRVAAPLVEDAEQLMSRYANDLVTEIRAAEGVDRKSAKRLMETVLDISMPLIASDDIALLKEKAAAAAVSA